MLYVDENRDGFRITFPRCRHLIVVEAREPPLELPSQLFPVIIAAGVPEMDTLRKKSGDGVESIVLNA
jgi:hypothetical protein